MLYLSQCSFYHSITKGFQINSERRKEHEETKNENRFGLSLFVCCNVTFQHCQLAPASAENHFQTDSEESDDPTGQVESTISDADRKIPNEVYQVSGIIR